VKTAPSIKAYILKRILFHRLVFNRDGFWYVGFKAPDNAIDTKTVRLLLRQDLHREMFLTSRQVKDYLDEILGAIEAKIRTSSAAP
jgi:hypothetical protein